MTDHKPSLATLAQLARTSPNLLANSLFTYQNQQGLDDPEVAAFLGCTIDALHLLALCRHPRQAPHFRDDVQRIAAYVGANELQLAKLIRAVDAWAALGQASNSNPSMLQAARDHDLTLENAQDPSEDDPADG